ncbi:MAG: ATP-binding protein [Hymenobacter sp.]|nr:MAG: ATP-binding protein [Hymenobacter sp.]
MLPQGLPAATEGAADAYGHWAEIRQNKTLLANSSPAALRRLFEFLGFEVEAVEPAQVLDRAGHQYLDLRTRILHDRQQCPVGRFGSEAKGRYRVLSVWGPPPDPAELSRLVAKCSNRDSAVLVLLWEALPWPQSEELGLHCRREGLSFLVFDELLFLYLLTFGAPARRLGLFFQLQLPFVQLNPYQVSGKIPSEMFFGREQEKRRLVSHQADGAIIVYGGRQLGKTMLLHQAVRENHCPEEERYVVFRDIYQLGRDIQNINRLAYELMQLCRSQQIGEWPASWREDITLRRVLEQLTKWVLAHPQRTLLVLLDEADELLEQDAANDFALVSELRRAMDSCRTKDESGTRLKIVFSGLHNVQRTLNLPSQPFVQLGKPMNIGPLEPDQGIALVRTPLESLGFCFGQLDAADG